MKIKNNSIFSPNQDEITTIKKKHPMKKRVIQQIKLYGFSDWEGTQLTVLYQNTINKINRQAKYRHECAIQEKTEDGNLMGVAQYFDDNPDRTSFFPTEYRKMVHLYQDTDTPHYLPQAKKTLDWSRKFDFLCHLVIQKGISTYNEDNPNQGFYLSSSLLYRLFGKDYNKMLRLLCSLGFIELLHKGYLQECSEYKLGRDIQITRRTFPYQVFRKFVEKQRTFYESTLEERMKTHDSGFLSNYQKCLNQLCISKTQELDEYMNSHLSENSFKKIYWEMIREMYDHKKTLLSQDNNMRIYSILTQTPREMKCFLNRKYEVDICNAHPLFFNIILQIFESQSFIHKHTKDIIERNSFLSLIFSSLISSHTFCEFAYNLLKYNKLKLDKEIQEYRRMTYKGTFWNEILERFNLNADCRKQIKKEYFSKVFYGKALRYAKDDRYINDFQDRFPSIWAILLHIRKGMAEIGQATWLPNILMRIESEIIQATLKKLYEDGYEVLNIHDAFFVLDVDANSKLTPKHIEELLISTLKEYGLEGNIKVEI